MLTWWKNSFLVASTVANRGLIYTTTDTKLKVLVVTLSTQDNVKQDNLTIRIKF